MLPWIERFDDWVRRNLRGIVQRLPRLEALHHGYEKAGLQVWGQPLPWCAESVFVEAHVRFSSLPSFRKEDFALHLTGRSPVSPTQLRRSSSTDQAQIRFRVPAGTSTLHGELFYRGVPWLSLTLPYLSQEAFLSSLRLEHPTVAVRLGKQSVPCQTYLARQCRGLMVGGLLSSPTSLLPLLDLSCRVEGRSHKGTLVQAPVSFSSGQLLGQQALVQVILDRLGRRPQRWTLQWIIGDRILEHGLCQGVSLATFQRSLRILNERFLALDSQGRAALRALPTVLAGDDRLGPCFFLASSLPGMAAWARLEVGVQRPGSEGLTDKVEPRVLVQDVPTLVSPGTWAIPQLERASGFALHVQGHSLGLLSLRPAPHADFTSEGGFTAAPSFPWTQAEEEEMTERLNRLLEG